MGGLRGETKNFKNQKKIKKKIKKIKLYNKNK